MRSRLDGIPGWGEQATTSNDNDWHQAERHDSEGDKAMSAFVDQIDTARALVESIERNLMSISETHDEALSAISDTQKVDNQNKVDALTLEVEQDGNKVRNILKQISDQNKKTSMTTPRLGGSVAHNTPPCPQSSSTR